MKKMIVAAIGLMMVMNANAQFLNDSATPFEQGKMYVNAAWSGTTLTYSKATDFQLGIGAKAGYFFMDNLMGLAVVDINSTNNFDFMKTELGAGARWYFDAVGIYVGAIAKYVYTRETTNVVGVAGGDVKLHPTFNDFRPEINAGYSFFLNRNITLEPEVYYEQSFKDSDYSGFGLRIGLGIYFNL